MVQGRVAGHHVIEESPLGRDQPILVLSRKKPHLILIMLASLLTGVVVFGGGSLDPHVPGWLARLWGGTAGVTGALALLAHLQRWDRERGMYVERGTLLIQSGAVLGYGLALVGLLGWGVDAVASGVLALAWAGANMWEVRLIGTDLRTIAAVRRLNRGVPGAADR